ncbi:MAG: hypothetical protein M1546_17665 [Chloroflexi bacterium]|nr:hypothetical protein [Chloroflexota bacterium]
MAATLEPDDRAKVREFLQKRFSFEELETLAFDLGIDYNALPHTTTTELSMGLIGHFERRDNLNCLLTKALSQRYDCVVARISARLPPGSPRTKVQIIVAQDVLENLSVIVADLAAKLRIDVDQVELIGAAWGSLRLLVGLPQEASDTLVRSEIHGLVNGRYRVVSITAFGSLDTASQKAWRLLVVHRASWQPVPWNSAVRRASWQPIPWNSMAREKQLNKLLSWIAVVVPILVALIGAIGLIIASRAPPSPSTSTPEPITSKYSFEQGVMGWVKQVYTDSQSCVEISRTGEMHYEGRYSLAMRMDLVGADPDDRKRKGEAWVDMMTSPPASGESIPLDLTNRIVTAQVYAPQGARGDDQHPNGFQIFVKDEKFRSLYGPWSDVAEGRWIQITMTVSSSAQAGGSITPGFDPSRIRVVGVKMAAGDDSKATYGAIVYIDKVDW